MNELQIAVLHPFVYSALLVLVYGTIIGLSRFYFVGTKQQSYKTLTPGAPQGPTWYASLNRVYINSIEALALFTPAFILLLMQNTHLEMLKTLTWVFLFGRILYALVYIGGGYTIVCSVFWLVGFVATLASWLFLLA